MLDLVIELEFYQSKFRNHAYPGSEMPSCIAKALLMVRAAGI